MPLIRAVGLSTFCRVRNTQVSKFGNITSVSKNDGVQMTIQLPTSLVCIKLLNACWLNICILLLRIITFYYAYSLVSVQGLGAGGAPLPITSFIQTE